jgi:hypothetical protein
LNTAWRSEGSCAVSPNDESTGEMPSKERMKKERMNKGHLEVVKLVTFVICVLLAFRLALIE